MIDRENRSKVTEGPVPEDGRPRDRSKVTEGPVPEDGRPREQVQNHRRACPQVLFLRKAELGFFQFFRNNNWLAGTFRWSEDATPARLVPSTTEDPAC
jgi:hypothetical protein